MRILQITSAQTLGGGERHLADLANGLAGRGHDVYVATRPNSAVVAELHNLPKKNITALPLRNSLDATSAQALARFVARNKIEIVHAHMARDYPLAAYAARRNPNSRLIVTRHVLFQLKRWHRITLSKAARVIAVSEGVARQLRTDNVVPGEKIRVVLNGIDTQKFVEARAKFDRQGFFERWHLPYGSLLVGTVGELTPLKGQEEFLLAAVEIVKEFPETHFVIAGIDHTSTNEHRLGIEKLIDSLQLKSSVTLVGWLEDLAQLYCALDVFVSASHTESFGLAIAEAMASSTAVVSTATDGARELIKMEETGQLVPIGDVANLTLAIRRLLKNKDERVRLGRAAQEAASANFSLERMIDETEEIYRAAIHENR